MTATQKQSISVSIDPRVLEALKKYQQVNPVTRSGLIENLLKQYLKDHAKTTV